MNTQTELRKQMHDQVDRIDGSPISLDDVVGTAGTIRRRRRLATGTAVLAAAAVVVPTALFGGGILDDRTSPAPAEQEQTVEFHDAVIGPDAPEGPAPKLAYTDAERLVLPSGETIEAAQVYEGTAQSGEEYVAAWGQSGGEPMVDILDASGQVLDSAPAISAPVGSPNGDFAAWIHPDGTVEVRRDGVGFALGKVKGESPQVVAATSNGRCDDEPEGCRVFVNPQEGQPVAVDFDGNVEPVRGGFTQVAAVSSDGLIAGRTSPFNADPTKPVCSAVFDDYRGHQQLFETCDLAFNWSAGFSPDNTLLVGYHSDTDGAGPRSMTVVDARTGETVTRIDLAKKIERSTVISGATWEDDEHLLVRTFRGAETSPGLYNLYRVGIDGSVEQLLEHDYDNDTMTSPWLFVR